jgi:hypothetical protein
MYVHRFPSSRDERFDLRLVFYPEWVSFTLYFEEKALTFIAYRRDEVERLSNVLAGWIDEGTING